MLNRVLHSGWRYGIVAIPVWCLDQWSKAWVVQSIPLYRFEAWTTWLGLTHLHNTGASFSFLADAGGWQRHLFLGLALLISIGIMLALSRMTAKSWVVALALGLILGGALGNAYDRLMLGYVVDFISVHWNNRWFFPAFNVADSAITAGAALLLLDAWLGTAEEAG
jgi:signal peptidase II